MYLLFNVIRAFALSCKKKRAILTVETAMVLPLFLMAVITIMTLLSACYINGRIEAAVNEEARYVSLKYRDGYSVAAVRLDIESMLGDRFFDSSVLRDGKDGFDYSDTDLSDSEINIIAVSYAINAPFDLFSVCEITFQKRVVIHSWIGYINGLNGYSDGSDFVYMAKNGYVYHRSRECSHIRLVIRAVSGDDLASLRNENGAKYKRCDFCHPSTSEKKLYVTADGDRYHNTLMCSGLKRSIVRVRISDIGETPPCSRCGY